MATFLKTCFDTFTDVGAREELTQVFTRELPHEVQQVLDLLAASPLGIPFPLLQLEFDRPELALFELRHRSLVDRDSFEQGRAALLSLAREARQHQLSREQKEQIEQRVTDLYTQWLYNLQQYQDDAEQAAANRSCRYFRSTTCPSQGFSGAGRHADTYG
ncbi:MAG TPA: hypothetical protein VKB35_05900 [Ktedonobacteraceae bacterium]|nr:hypothetical protein [Ktedonobacteraceae bacterium]